MGDKIIEKLRKYGKPPYKIAVLHGGPGALGEMASVARELSQEWGIIEPLQTARSLRGQVEELHDVLKENAELPVVLIGFSWGAWIAYLFAAEYPSTVTKIILVGSGPFESKYAEEIIGTRMSRLTKEEQSEFNSIAKKLENKAIHDDNSLFQRFGDLLSKADSYKPIKSSSEEVEVRYDVYESVWPEGERLRKEGKLLEYGRRITCPVVAIHGDYDPHPSDGVRVPLTQTVQNFRFVLLQKCGHKPWVEQEAKDTFYEIVRDEVSKSM